MKVCICFFGLTRSLRYTKENLNKNIFDVLELNNFEYDIYLHTYNLKKLTNKRSHEIDCILDNNEYKLLNLKDYIIDNQDKFDKSFNYNAVKIYGDSWKDNFSSLKNLIRQLNSLKKVFSLVENKKNYYDSFMFLRPDLLFNEKIDVNYITLPTKNENVIITPSWQKCNGYNDRFAIGSFNSIKIYANRLDYINEFTKIRALHSERLLKFVMDKFNIKNIDANIFFQRLRANNIVCITDVKYFKKKKKPPVVISKKEKIITPDVMTEKEEVITQDVMTKSEEIITPTFKT